MSLSCWNYLHSYLHSREHNNDGFRKDWADEGQRTGHVEGSAPFSQLTREANGLLFFFAFFLV